MQYGLFKWVNDMHKGQKRKDGAPYIDHLTEVAAISKYFCPDEPLVVEVALCHDLLEDTHIASRELAVKLMELGYTSEGAWDITTDVSSLTCEKIDKPRAVRKGKYADKMEGASWRAQHVKLADIVSNFLDTSCLAPKFLNKYCAEKLYLLPLLVKGEPHLWELANELVQKANGTPHRILIKGMSDPAMNGIRYVSDEAYDLLNRNTE